MVVRDFTAETEARLCAELQKSVDEAEALVSKLENCQHSMCNRKGIQGEISRAKSLKGEREELVQAVHNAFNAAREKDFSYAQNTQHIGDNVDRYVQFVKTLTATIQGNVSAADIHARLDEDATAFKKSIAYKGESRTTLNMTDKDYHALATLAYKIEDEDFSFKPGDLVNHYVLDGTVVQDFRVVAVTDEGNGMQAIALAPIVKGYTDTGHIVIAYAGTEHLDDWREDAAEIVAGVYVSGGQLDTAKKFYNDVRAQYPDAQLSTTGHSLGGFLAISVAAENRVPSTSFCAPNPSRSLSPDARRYVKDNPELYTNYRVAQDPIGNFGGDVLGIAKYTGAQDGWAHGVSENFQFNSEGDIEILDARVTPGTAFWGTLEGVEPAVEFLMNPFDNRIMRYIDDYANEHSEKNPYLYKYTHPPTA